MRRVDARRASLAQQSPARCHSRRIVLRSKPGRRQIAGENRPVVEHERNAVVRVPRRVHDLARDVGPEAWSTFS
jgi:hypothetical protein